jgi:hypothetical protein
MDYQVIVPDMIKKLFKCEKCRKGQNCPEHNEFHKGHDHSDGKPCQKVRDIIKVQATDKMSDFMVSQYKRSLH